MRRTDIIPYLFLALAALAGEPGETGDGQPAGRHKTMAGKLPAQGAIKFLQDINERLYVVTSGRKGVVTMMDPGAQRPIVDGPLHDAAVARDGRVFYTQGDIVWRVATLGPRDKKDVTAEFGGPPGRQKRVV